MRKYLYSNVNDYSKKDISNFYNHIYQEKKERVSKYLNKDKYKSSIIGEILLHNLLEKENIKYEEQQFIINEYGKPYINNKRLFFNISHSYDYVITIISDKEIGIDIEKIRKTNLNTIDIFATQKEKEYILSSENDIYKRLFQIYTLKEAYFKMLGKDLSRIKEVEFIIDNNNNNNITCSDKKINAYSSDRIDNYIFSICKKKS